MQTFRTARVAGKRALLAEALQWRHSMFWKIVPTMFLTSCAVAFGLMSFATIREDARLRRVLAPAELRPALERTLQLSMPLPVQASLLQRWCADSLPVLAERMLAKLMADSSGDRNENGFSRSLDAGRLAVSLATPAGQICTFASDQVAVMPALRGQMAAHGQAGSASGTGTGVIVEQPDGWISVATAAPQGKDGPALTIGIYTLSPFAKLMQPRSVYQNLAQFIIIINILTALILVALLMRRIRRANHAAEAWASGMLATRINDRGRDEFSLLTQKFDQMADAMSGVIEVKQALAAAEERNRLARDLHDSAKQRAFALNLQLSAARGSLLPDTPEARLVDAALMLTGQLQGDLADVIRRLAAPTIAEAGLRHVLTEGIQRLLMGSPVRWSLVLDGQDEARLDAMPEVARQLSLIALEAVANVLKHAHATQCVIRGARAGACFRWSIVDNGTGLPAGAGKQAGMGLANMRIRADSLPDGTVAIVPGEGGGTIVLVTFALTA